jgi:hypothetical protein
LSQYLQVVNFYKHALILMIKKILSGLIQPIRTRFCLSGWIVWRDFQTREHSQMRDLKVEELSHVYGAGGYGGGGHGGNGGSGSKKHGGSQKHGSGGSKRGSGKKHGSRGGSKRGSRCW